MDQIYQLQRQIQDLRQEVNNISQVASQLQRTEANNAAQLQRIQQNETIAAQQLQTIQQLCNRLTQDFDAFSNVAQQVSSQMAMRPYTGTNIGTGMQSPVQFGAFGAQFGPTRTDDFARNQYISSMAANRYGMGFNTPDYASNQYISNLSNQGILGSQSGYGTTGYSPGSFGTAMSPSGYTDSSTGNFNMIPSHPVQTGQFGMTGNIYNPNYSIGQLGATSQLNSGMFSNQPYSTTGIQSMGRYSSF